jgi:Rps23 Pro-64 3,4-dihydroxylase Tpa1-like proline 4-hydroxylase
MIADRLRAEGAKLRAQWNEAKPFRYCFLDNVLPEPHVRRLGEEVPKLESLFWRKSVRESKRAAVQFADHEAGLQAAVFAFQDARVVQAIAAITGLPGLEADPSLYASGISVMGKGDYLHPHLDNSHDGDGQRYRVLNLLFYVTPDWRAEYGGSLELWSRDAKTRIEVEARCNRLVLMETHAASWHSVNEVKVDRHRACVSNYYFSATPASGRPHRQVTLFRGRPEHTWRRAILFADGILRTVLGRAFPFLLRRTRHRRKENQ